MKLSEAARLSARRVAGIAAVLYRIADYQTMNGDDLQGIGETLFESLRVLLTVVDELDERQAADGLVPLGQRLGQGAYRRNEPTEGFGNGDSVSL